ncbi:helix-turn-helix domain-containing protein [Prevotella sp. A2931]|uniref:Helix-turn-helix domain-containing protein n=1 Tax=Prevotella illustrans TaxID=2800387 RepID=A0ABS3M293_9BACT|nr:MULTISPECIES: two-component regulator propeller domain-containing protein [Prevotella]MBO1362302.1 helix-turn-helix domain-containing protein [Prevotella illustrans]PTL26447.1 hypothetical protein C3V39_04925 [Prevotella sp. oral taxon 820]
MKSLSRHVFLFIALWFSGLMEAGGTQPYFNNIQPEGASTVCSFAHDRQGMVWLGTESGLYSYDGYRCYPHFDGHSPYRCRVHSLVAHRNLLYLGSENGLFVFDTAAGNYRPSPRRSPKDIRAMALHGRKLLLGTSDGLYEYDVRQETFRSVALRGQAVYALLPSPHGLLIGSLQGLYILKGGGIRRLAVTHGRQPLVNALAFDGRRGRYWIGTEGALYHTDLKEIVPLAPLHGNSIKALAVRQGGDVWIGTDDGLFVYALDGSVSRLVHDARSASSLANNIVWALDADSRGNVWVGTDNGLSFHKGGSAFVYTPLADVTGSGDGNSLHNIYRQTDGTMWMGGTNGLLRFRPTFAGYSDVAWYRQNSTRFPLSHNRVRSVFQDADGDIWVATDHGINYYDRQRQQFRNFVLTEPTGHYNSNWAYDVLLDGRGRLWVSAYMGGIFIIDKRRLLRSEGVVRADHHLAGGPRELRGIHVGQLAQDRRGRVWAMVYDEGLCRVDPQTLRPDSMIGRPSFSYVTTDGRGNVWAGYDGGVLRVDADGTSPVDIRFNDGIGKRSVTTMADVAGRMYVFSGSVCRVIHDGKIERHFIVPLLSAVTSLYVPATRSLYIGGNDGFVTLSAPVPSTRMPSDRLFLTSLLVNGREYAGGRQAVLSESSVKLRSRDNNLSFRFTDLPYAGGLRSLYVYRLEGIDRAWHDLDNLAEAVTYNGLPHGRYRLLVRNIDAPSQRYAYTLDIRIKAPWYLTLWAKLVYLLLAMGAGLWVMNFYAMRKNLRQEQTARRRLLEQSHARATFFALLSERLKQPLAHILAPVYQLLAADRGDELLEDIRSNATALNRMIYESLDSDGEAAETRQQPFPTPVDVVTYLRRVVARRKAEKQAGPLRLDTDVASLTVCVDIVRWDIVVQTLVDFVGSHAQPTGETVITLRSDLEKQRLTLTIGNGTLHIGDIERNQLFMLYAASADNEPPAYTGLFVIRQYVETSKGSLTLDQGGSGSWHFRVVLPIDNHRTASLPDRQPVADKLFAQATAVIETHIADADFNVTGLQAALGVGDKFLYRKIKQQSGMSPVEYIRNIRMRKASLLLREGKYSISEVMFMVGFSNPGYFSKCFQRAYGMTPTEYLKRQG